MPDNVKITFNRDIESTDKACSIISNASRALRLGTQVSMTLTWTFT